MTAIECIRNVDDAIALLRSFCMDAVTEDERQKWLTKINEALDRRIELMRLRDGKERAA
jgi:hypothetical protein